MSNLGNYTNKELEILKKAINLAAEKKGRLIAQNPVMKQIIHVLEDFIREKELVCYGGTAINNILPEEDQFYNRDIEIPDYDVFSSNAIKDAKELADKYFKLGFTEVEAKAGVHHGTYKVYVNFFQIADITQIDKNIFKNLKKDAIRKDGIYYAPPNFLRMAMYTELSRPAGDVSRWEKVLKRLILLNKNYPLHARDCDKESFKKSLERFHSKYDMYEIHELVRDVAIKEGLLFLGGYATSLYSRYVKNEEEKYYLEEIPDIDLLSVDPEKSAKNIKKILQENDIRNVKIIKKEPIGEYLAEHVIITIDDKNIIYIYKPLSCHSYNNIKIGNDIIHVASIDTMLSYFLIFLYADKPYFDENRILCLCEYLLKVQQRNRLRQRGLLRRFSINCYGEQPTLEEIRNEKALQYKKLKDKKKSKEYEEWFLRYIPMEKKNKKLSMNKTKSLESKKKTRSRTRKENKTKELMGLRESVQSFTSPIEEMWLNESIKKKDNIDKTVSLSSIIPNSLNDAGITVTPQSKLKSNKQRRTKKNRDKRL